MPPVFKTCILSIFEWPLKTCLTVFILTLLSWWFHWTWTELLPLRSQYDVISTGWPTLRVLHPIPTGWNRRYTQCHIHSSLKIIWTEVLRKQYGLRCWGHNMMSCPLGDPQFDVMSTVQPTIWCDVHWATHNMMWCPLGDQHSVSYTLY